MNITDFKFELSLRDPADKVKYHQDDEMWDKAENALRKIMNDIGIPYEEKNLTVSNGKVIFNETEIPAGNYRVKINLYAENGIILGQNLIISMETKNCELDTQYVEKIIQKFLI